MRPLSCRTFESSPITIEDLRPLFTMPESGMVQALYVLWLGGVLARSDWNAAFSAAKIGEIRRAKMSLVRRAQNSTCPTRHSRTTYRAAGRGGRKSIPRNRTSVFRWTSTSSLSRIPKRFTTFFRSATRQRPPNQVRRYFEMAKLFHPDRYHRESAVLLRRIQLAFTEITRAYETLKDPDSRKTYDFKVRKEIAARAKRHAAGQPETAALPTVLRKSRSKVSRRG